MEVDGGLGLTIMKGYDAPRYSQPPYDQYSTQPFPATQQAEKFAHLNQQAFASNNAVGGSIGPYTAPGPAVLSCQPTSGVFGTKVFLKISSQYDLFSLSTVPYFFLQFGSEKCPLQDVTRESQDSGGNFVYSCSADAPQPLVTGCETTSVPLSLVIEGPAAEEISRTVAGSFQYLETTEDEVTRTKMSKPEPPAHQVTDHENVSPKTNAAALPADAGTNSYEDPTQQGQYTNTTFPQGTDDMISTYRSSSFVEPPYHRRSAHGWTGFPGTLGSTGRTSSLDHRGMGGRSSLTPLPMPSTNASGAPQLVRTSTITNPGGATPYSQVSLYSHKAVLKINGKLESMAENWTQEEWSNRRRIVMFRRSQTGSTLNASFRAVPVNERPPNSICISCIWWAEKGECFVTSVDTIYLLEQLVMGPTRFSVEEKNRIRRNLEGFHPLTVSKGKAESEEFFKLIMAFPNPKPRNIEKDVKVFPWKILESALKKIIGKYSASPSSAPPPPPSMIAPPPYATLPTPPGQGMSSHPSDQHSQYSVHSSHHDPIPSPRSLSGSQPSWTPYTTAQAYHPATTRTLSPNIRQPSPQQQHPPPMRINTNPLPAVTTYDTRTVSTGGYGSTGLHTPISSHHPSTATPPRWDPTPASYADGYPSLNSHHHPHLGQPVYSTAPTYPDGGAPRA